MSAAISIPNPIATPDVRTVSGAPRAEQWRALFDGVSVAASTDATRHNLNGVYLEVNADGWMRATATDGHRLHSGLLSIGSVDFADGRNEWKGILPSSALAKLRKALSLRSYSARSRVVHFEARRRDVAFRVSNGDALAFECIDDGYFPDYRQVIPNAHKRGQNGEQLSGPIRPFNVRAAVNLFRAIGETLPRGASCPAVCMVDDGKGGLSLSYSADIARSVGDFTITGSGRLRLADGDTFRTPIGVNVYYFADALAFTQGPIRYIDNLSPMLFGDVDGNFAFVMPVRL